MSGDARPVQERAKVTRGNGEATIAFEEAGFNASRRQARSTRGVGQRQDPGISFELRSWPLRIQGKHARPTEGSAHLAGRLSLAPFHQAVPQSVSPAHSARALHAVVSLPGL